MLADCTCGCGRKVPKRLMPINLKAFALMAELAEWDRFRFNLKQEGLEDDEFSSYNSHIEEGALLYKRLLQMLHGELPYSAPREWKSWVKSSRKARRKMAKRYPGLIEGRIRVRIADESLADIDLLHPDHSFTG